MKYLNRSLLATMIAMAYMAPEGEAASVGGTGVTATPVTNGTLTTSPGAAPTEQEVAAAAAVKEELHNKIKANFNNLVDVAEIAFHFRKVKDEETKLETKRPTVTIPVPVPSVEGVIAIFEAGGKQLDLLMEAVRTVITDQAREIINENESLNADNFPYEKLGWDFIANMPKAERRGGGIAKELWDDFAEDYIAIMPALANKTEENVKLAAKVFTTKFANAKTNKPVLKLLQQQLAIYTSNTAKGEQVAPVIEWLSNKLDTLINTEETNLLLNL